MKIQNGWGDGGWFARINSEGQILTVAELETEARHISADGKVIIISTGIIATSANTTPHGVLFIRNDSTTSHLHVGLVKLSNELPGVWKWYKNPTSVSNSSNATEENFNFSSSSTIDATTSKGSATAVITGGTEFVTHHGGFFGDMAGALILGPTNSLAFEFALDGATAGEVEVNVQVWPLD